ncbi:MAG: hypothetical protein NTU73_06025 [Ignavibacteriae bacterium]|nr:hypothetical protein [Ignavibacteriota bacterium]
MRNLLLKVLLVLLFCLFVTDNSSAQYTTPYKKQIKYLLDDTVGNKFGFKFQFKYDDKNTYDVNFSVLDSVNWSISIKQDTTFIIRCSYPFDIIHQIGLVKPSKSSQPCILVVSATGGNEIITNEFTIINPEFDNLMNVQIHYVLKYKNTTFDYNKASLDEHRTDEIKFIIGLVGEYDMIWYERYKEKK